jgi:phage internal scaffolding protein
MTFYRPHNRVTTPVGEHSMTEQIHKNSCDINQILKQYQLTGIINHIQKQNPQYLDLPSTSDYQQSMNLILQSQEAFASLPSVVRDHFANDPRRLLAALTDPAQAEKLREWGILKPLPSTPAEPTPARDAHSEASV